MEKSGTHSHVADHGHGHEHGRSSVVDFKFEGYQRTVLLGFMVLGLVCMGLTFFGDPDPYKARFWSNLLHNTVFFTGISFISLFVMCAFITAYAGWHAVIKRIWEAYSMFLIVGLGLLMVIAAGIWMGWHHLYHWADPASVAADKLLTSKAPFLNKYWYTFGTLGIVGMWYMFAVRFRSLSLSEDRNGENDADDNKWGHHRKMRVVAGFFLPIAAFTSAAMIWQWVMSIDAHWYSTMFAWYSTASWFVAAMSLTVLTIIYLKSLGYYESVTPEHIHDLGKFIFAFSIFWAYLWFSQFMLIWYANVGEETIYFRHRLDNYPFLFWANLVMNFALPFFILMRNSTKRKLGTVGFVAFLLLFAHWFDFFQMIKPGVLHTSHELSHGSHGHGDAHDDHHGMIPNTEKGKAVFTALTDQTPLKDKLEQTGDKVGDKLKNAGKKIGDKFKKAGKKAGAAAQNAGDKVGEAAQNVGDKVGETAQNVGDKVEDAAHKAGEHVEHATSDAKHNLQGGANANDGHGHQDGHGTGQGHSDGHQGHDAGSHGHDDGHGHTSGHDDNHGHDGNHAKHGDSKMNLDGGHGHGGHAGADSHGHGDDAHGGGHDAHGHEAHAVPFTAGFTIPGLLEIGTFLGFLALFLFLALGRLSKAKLEPVHDPYLGESYHHHS